MMSESLFIIKYRLKTHIKSTILYKGALIAASTEKHAVELLKKEIKGQTQIYSIMNIGKANKETPKNEIIIKEFELK